MPYRTSRTGRTSAVPNRTGRRSLRGSYGSRQGSPLHSHRSSRDSGDDLWADRPLDLDPARASHTRGELDSATPWRGRGFACIARSTGRRGYAPRPVAMERAPARGASPPPGALSYRTGRCPIGQVGRGGRARCLIGRGDDPFAGVMDPDRDPRFIATGRAAIAAMTCGQIDLLTSTPLGRRTYQGVWQSVRRPGGVAIACFARSTGLRGYAPRPRGYGAGTHKGCLRSPTLHN